MHRTHPVPFQRDDSEHERCRDAARDLHEDAVGIAVAGDGRERNEVLQVVEPGHGEGGSAENMALPSEIMNRSGASTTMAQAKRVAT